MDSRDCADLLLLITDDSLPMSRKMSRIEHVHALDKIDFYSGAEEARRIVNYLYTIQCNGKSVFKEILGLNGHSILEISEAFLINDLLGPLLNKIIAVTSKIETLLPCRILLFRPYSTYEKIIAELFAQEIGASFKRPSLAIVPQEFQLNHNVSIKINFRIPSIFYGLLSNAFALSRYIRYKAVYRKYYCRKHFGSRKRIIFFTVNKKQTDTVIPIVKYLDGDTELEPIVIDWGSDAVSFLVSKGIISEQFESFFNLDLLRQDIVVGMRILHHWNFIKKKTIVPSVRYGKYNISNLVIEELDKIFRFHIYAIIRDYLIGKRIIEDLGANAVFVTNERECIAKSCVFAAKSSGINSYSCQRGVIGDHPEVGPIATDKIFVNGYFFKKNLVKRGVNPDDVIVTGNPRFDSYLKNAAETNKSQMNVYKQLDIEPYENIVLIIEQPMVLAITLEDKVRSLEASLKALMSIKNVRVIIKLHPNQPNDKIERKVISELGLKNVIILRDELDLFALLSSSILVIMRQSTVGLDAVLLKKPLIVLSIVGRGKQLMPYAEYGVALEAQTSDEIRQHIQTIISGKYFSTEDYERSRERFIQDFFYKMDRKSTERVVEILKKSIIR